MTARASVLPAALLRAGLLAVVMAVVAGIFGMHVMTADHSSHAAHADVALAAGDSAVGQSPGGHSAAEHAAVGHSHAGHAATLTDAVGAAFTASESCSAGCPDVREEGASCTPLAKTGSLAAAPPPASPTALLAPVFGTHGAAGYSFVPPSKTPCDLSISRT
ncbi:hypothetical protein [Pseudarthrobacter sp. NKDBFgelt]|uniref:hypothetical protein n=1 Tax=Pseudarthrobacter sp. NKDBFgelt TaxID=3384443 RepID=UPI0038D46533